jgi:hypothetical protein
MKKLIFILIGLLFTYISYPQERELSDYEKYRMEKEKEIYYSDEVPDTVYVVEKDTVYVEKETDQTVVNNYYVDNDYDYDWRFRTHRRLYFSYNYYPRHYSYWDTWYYDSWYYDSWYYGYNYYPRYYSYYYPRHYYWGNHYHHHYYYNYPKYYRGNTRYYASSSLGRTKYYSNPYYLG